MGGFSSKQSKQTGSGFYQQQHGEKHRVPHKACQGMKVPGPLPSSPIPRSEIKSNDLLISEAQDAL